MLLGITAFEAGENLLLSSKPGHFASLWVCMPRAQQRQLPLPFGINLSPEAHLALRGRDQWGRTGRNIHSSLGPPFFPILVPLSFPFILPLPGFVLHSPLSTDDAGRNLETGLILDFRVLFSGEETQECAACGRQWSSFTGWIFSPSGMVLGCEAPRRNEVGGWSLYD